MPPLYHQDFISAEIRKEILFSLTCTKKIFLSLNERSGLYSHHPQPHPQHGCSCRNTCRCACSGPWELTNQGRELFRRTALKRQNGNILYISLFCQSEQILVPRVSLFKQTCFTSDLFGFMQILLYCDLRTALHCCCFCVFMLISCHFVWITIWFHSIFI